jgi:hypothetical protein
VNWTTGGKYSGYCVYVVALGWSRFCWTLDRIRGWFYRALTEIALSSSFYTFVEVAFVLESFSGILDLITSKFRLASTRTWCSSWWNCSSSWSRSWKRGCGRWHCSSHWATHSNRTFTFFDNLRDKSFTANIWAFTFKYWTRIIFIGTFTQKFTAFFTNWLRSWLTDGRWTATFVNSFYKHFTWSTNGNLDAWTGTVNTFVFSGAAAFGAINKTCNFLNLAFTTGNLFKLWTFNRLLFFGTAVAW